MGIVSHQISYFLSGPQLKIIKAAYIQDGRQNDCHLYKSSTEHAASCHILINMFAKIIFKLLHSLLKFEILHLIKFIQNGDQKSKWTTIFFEN